MMRYEWKKIFERRLNVIAMLLGYLLIGICVFSYITQESFYDEKTDSYIEGIEAFRLDEERAKGQTGAITEEYVTEVMQKIQSRGMDLESDEAYVEIIRQIGDVFYLLAKNYMDMGSEMIDKNAIMRADLSEGAQFYGQRMKKIIDYLNMDFSYGNYSETEKAYWIGKAENTKIPFAWGSKAVMNMVWDLITVGAYLWFVVVICTSSVFSSEYESGAASLLLTTKYGKNRMVWIKIGVSVIFAVGYIATGLLAAAGTVGLFLGFPGVGLPIQLWDSVIPYNLTIGQVCLENMALVLLIGMTITLIVLCCSARFRSSLATLVAGMALIIAPVFFRMGKGSGLWNHINYLFPIRAVLLKDMLNAFVSYPVGNYVIPHTAMVVIVYTILGVGALLLIRRMFVKMG